MNVMFTDAAISSPSFAGPPAACRRLATLASSGLTPAAAIPRKRQRLLRSIGRLGDPPAGAGKVCRNGIGTAERHPPGKTVEPPQHFRGANDFVAVRKANREGDQPGRYDD